MKHGFTIALVCLALAGCGGVNLSPTSDKFPAGFYRGTYQFHADGLPDAVAPMVADVKSNGDLTAHAFSTTVNSTISVEGSDGSVVHNGVALTGGATLTEGFNVLQLSIIQTNTFTVTSNNMTLSTLPTLGATHTVPAAGNFSGELLVVSDGHVKALGTVTATVNGDGTWTATSSGGLAWVNSGIFSGKFEAGGTLSSGSVFISGNVINQPTPPAFSNDGTTLIVRYDKLALEPASAWLTLTAAP